MLSPFSALAAKVYAALAVAALLFGIVQTVRLDGFLWIDGARDKLAAREKSIAEMLAASATNAAKAETQRIAEENRSAELARRADYADAENARLRAENDRLRGLAGRFAADRSLRALRPSICTAAPSAEDSPSGDRDGPGADAVVLTRPEFDEFVANTLRLERVRKWGQSQIDADKAIPLVEFGAEAPPDE